MEALETEVDHFTEKDLPAQVDITPWVLDSL